MKQISNLKMNNNQRKSDLFPIQNHQNYADFVCLIYRDSSIRLKPDYHLPNNLYNLCITYIKCIHYSS